MAEYIPSPSAWVREQVELYERTNGAEGSTDAAGQAVIIVTNTGNKSGAVRKTPLMRVCDGKRYVLVGRRAARRRIRCGCTTCGRSRWWRSAIRRR